MSDRAFGREVGGAFQHAARFCVNPTRAVAGASPERAEGLVRPVPAERERPWQEFDDDGPPAPDTPDLTVLVVDDDPDVLNLIAVVLRRDGLGVVTASSGAQAVAAYRAGIGFALIDIFMPVQDGPQTLTALRRLCPQLRAAFVSGSPEALAPSEVRALGASAVIRKPFPSLDAFVAEVRALATR
ncbi:response regulator [Gemmata sp. JC717]|uniref:response regulator n=1 Tax=Gemmata algarum TaxID=2975278 RepID=UPI0021BB8029|nr:response regulator [Gemmata algarum]MDY3557164.1 response regulator [Gemmata algarum]